MTYRLLVLLCSILIAFPASAGKKNVPDCFMIDSQDDRRICFYKQSEKAQLAVQKFLTKAENKIKGDSLWNEAVKSGALIALSQAQKAWEAYVGAQCGDVQEYAVFGSGTSEAMSDCQIKKARARAAELKETYNLE